MGFSSCFEKSPFAGTYQLPVYDIIFDQLIWKIMLWLIVTLIEINEVKFNQVCTSNIYNHSLL